MNRSTLPAGPSARQGLSTGVACCGRVDADAGQAMWGWAAMYRVAYEAAVAQVAAERQLAWRLGHVTLNMN